MIVVGTTLAAFAMRDPDYWASWLRTAEDLRAQSPEPVEFFAALELDARGLDPFIPLCDRLSDLGGDWWTYHLDDGREEVTTANRIRHITCGQNLVTDRAVAQGASHLLFLAADMEPPSDALPKLLELHHPIVGGEVTTYCLSGPEVTVTEIRPDGRHRVHPFPFRVEEHMATAAFVLIERDVFRRIRWRYDIEEGWTDDPCYWHDCLDLLGVPTYVRKDCIGRHYPESIGAIETRGHDLAVRR